MSLTMHSASIPVYVRMLHNLSTWLDKAEAHAAAKKFDVTVLLNSRLAPDMLNFIKQVQIACDAAKGGAARLAGIEVPSWEDKEQTVAELKARIQRTIDYVQSLPAAQFDGAETRRVVIPMRNRDPIEFDGENFLRHWSLPNFFFHVTTAYDILRHNGVELGKADYLGGR